MRFLKIEAYLVLIIFSQLTTTCSLSAMEKVTDVAWYHTIKKHTKLPNVLAFLVTGYIKLQANGTVYNWTKKQFETIDLSSGNTLYTSPYTDDVACFATNSYYILAIARNNPCSIDFFNPTTKKRWGIDFKKKYTGQPTGLVWVNDSQLAAGTSNGAILIIDSNRKNITSILAHNFGHSTTLSSYEKGDLLSGSSAGSLILWNMQTRKKKLVIWGHEEAINCCAPLPCERIASSSQDTTIKIWNSKNKQCLQILPLSKSPVHTLISLHPKYLISKSAEGETTIWNHKKGTRICSKKIHSTTKNPTSLLLLPDNNKLVSTMPDKITTWHILSENLDEETQPTGLKKQLTHHIDSTGVIVGN